MENSQDIKISQKIREYISVNFIQNIEYNYFILILFALFEVLFFKSNNNIKLIISICEYAFILYAFFVNIQVGIMYFLSFTILTVGIGNYSGFVALPYNFWGLRFFGVSFAIMFTIFLSFLVLLKNRFILQININKYNNFILFLIFYGIFVGVVNVLLKNNYLDNFIRDLLNYLPAIFYLILLSQLTTKNTILILKKSVIIVFFMMLLSLVTDNKFKYGEDSFVLEPTLGLIVPFIFLFFSFLYKNNIYIKVILTLVLSFLLIKGFYFISGKVIVLFLILFLLLFIKSKKTFLLFFISTLFLVFYLKSILLYSLDFFKDYPVIQYKFRQVYIFVSVFDFHKIAKMPNSIGNIIAEFLAIVNHLKENINYLIFGKGFGGAIPDYLNNLSDWIHMSGYEKIDKARNQYFKMHLPVFEMFVKGGLILGVSFLYILYRALRVNKNYSIVLFILLFAFFYTSKESLLLTLIIIKVISETEELKALIKKK